MSETAGRGVWYPRPNQRGDTREKEVTIAGGRVGWHRRVTAGHLPELMA